MKLREVMSGKGAWLPVGAPAAAGVDASPAGVWWSPPPKLFMSAVLTVLLLWALDVSVVAPPSVHHLPSFYLGNFTVSKTVATSIAADGRGSRRSRRGRISATSLPQYDVGEDYGLASNSSSRSTGRAWITVPTPRNYTSNLMSRWVAAGADASRTADVSIGVPALDNVDDGAPGALRLPTADIHELAITALDENGRPRGLGGDYFEIDLSGPLWKSRPPVTDHGNGSYSFKFQVHPDFAGDYNLTVVLLFRSFEGLKFSPERFKFRKELRRMAITFYNGDGGERGTLPSLRVCRSSDFSKGASWSGRWTRHAKIDQCDVDDDGRYRCLPPDFPCARPWCEGPLGALESSGWVYSAHCAFRLFSQETAWKCLSGKWLFFWGDSNHVDTIRNLLNFVLGLWDVKSVPRRFDNIFANPSNGSETVRITSIFNGHWNETMNYLGLKSLRNGDFRRLLWKYFNEDGPAPDAMILNSGLHDGVHWRSVRAFADGADFAAQFWDDVLGHLRSKNNGTASSKMPRVFYRTTVATGGYARDLAFNPSKMDAFNAIFVEKLMEKGLLLSGGVIDDFDMTFPWHYDNRCNDGVHYGRGPAKLQWRDGQVGHQYFVDLMLAHVLLNAICNE